MNRRSTLKYLFGGGLLVALGGSHYWLSRDRDHGHLDLDALLSRLKALEPETIATSGAWQAARTFDHLAQSIEFSMVGYPELKSGLFRHSVGKLAFSVFQANGRMTHGLDEAIPGEVIQQANTDPLASRNRLITALETFDAFTRPLEPHFAYGSLSKKDYALAHVMHVNNHFEEFQIG